MQAATSTPTLVGPPCATTWPGASSAWGAQESLRRGPRLGEGEVSSEASTSRSCRSAPFWTECRGRGAQPPLIAAEYGEPASGGVFF